MGIGGNDAVTAKGTVESSNGDNGVPWIGGQGRRSRPASAGVHRRYRRGRIQHQYESRRDRHQSGTGRIGHPSVENLGVAGPKPGTGPWMWVGENIVTTCDTCRKDSIPGTGLLPKLYQESATVTTEIQNLVSGATPLTLTNLEQITAPGVAITRQVIEAIREMPASESRA